MSPISEHLVTWPLAAEKISSHGRVLISLLQSLVLLAVQPESGMAENADAVNVSDWLARDLNSEAWTAVAVVGLWVRHIEEWAES